MSGGVIGAMPAAITAAISAAKRAGTRARWNAVTAPGAAFAEAFGRRSAQGAAVRPAALGGLSVVWPVVPAATSEAA